MLFKELHYCLKKKKSSEAKIKLSCIFTKVSAELPLSCKNIISLINKFDAGKKIIILFVYDECDELLFKLQSASFV